MLDLECFAYLNRALESTISPIVILASNRGQTTIKGASDAALVSAHGIPPDLLSRLLIIPTHPYTGSEIRTIIQTRARLEFATPTAPSLSTAAGGQDVAMKVHASLSPEALEELTQQGTKVSLRYALQLLAPAGILARARGAEGAVISGDDVREATGLFWDAGRSAIATKDKQDLFIS
jgi:RuvB-like protein 1 (pontin 52)